MHAVHEVLSFAAGAAFDGGDVLELKLGHGNTPFEDPLNLIFFRSRISDHPDTQTARLILDELYIPDLIIECAVV